MVSMTPEESKLITDALATKTRTDQFICTLCQHSNWDVQSSLATISVIDSPPQISTSLPDAALPMVVLVCRHCGLTAFINLFVLGVGDQLGISRRSAKTNE